MLNYNFGEKLKEKKLCELMAKITLFDISRKQKFRKL